MNGNSCGLILVYVWCCVHFNKNLKFLFGSPVIYMLSYVFFFAVGRMKGFRDWVLSQVLSNSLISPTPLSGSDTLYLEDRPSEDLNDQGTTLVLSF